MEEGKKGSRNIHQFKIRRKNMSEANRTVGNTRVHYIQNKQAKLAPGHSLPSSKKPVYWMIWVLNAADSRHPGVPFHSRVTVSKLGTPREASQQCYGIDPTENMLFFNLSPRLSDMKKIMTETRKLWAEMGGFEG